MIAIALNLPIEVVGDEYVKYVDGKKLPGFAAFYRKHGPSGIRHLEAIDESMKSRGILDTKLAGRYVNGAKVIVDAGNTRDSLRMDLEELQKEKTTLAAQNAQLKKENASLRRENASLGKNVEQLKQYPNAKIPEIARKSIANLLDNRLALINMALDSLLYAMRINPDLRLLLQWRWFPETRPPDITNSLVSNGLNRLLPAVAKSVYDRLIEEARRRVSEA